MKREIHTIEDSIRYAQISSQDAENRSQSVTAEICKLQETIAKTKKEADSVGFELSEEMISVQELEKSVSEMRAQLGKKDAEAAGVREDVVLFSEKHDELLDEHYKTSKEYAALKDHANVLETQNKTVLYILENLVDDRRIG